VRVYEVQPGDSPASIASQDEMAGCPKCSIDLIRANPHKPTLTYPNGYVTFRELDAGEKLNLPDKWWSKEFDELPKSYFEALPYADGVTPGKKPGVGLAAAYSDALIAAAKRADAVLGFDDDCAQVARVGSSVNSAVHDFKVAWNAEQTPPVPINTGNYELQTAEAMRLILGEAYAPCPPRTATTTAPRVPTRIALPPAQKRISAGQVVGVALVGAGAVAGAIYLATGKRR